MPTSRSEPSKVTKLFRPLLRDFSVGPVSARTAVAALLLLAVGGLVTQVTIQAHFNNMKWITTTPTIRDATADYGGSIRRAIADYNSNTDVTIYTCSNSGCENWIHIQDDYGPDDFYARNFRTYYIQNPPPHNIVESETQWNEYWDSGNDDHVARHEIGHGLGFNHVECSTDSVMWPECPRPWPSSLESHDINDINGEY